MQALADIASELDAFLMRTIWRFPE